ncbi:MAG: penicillin-binding protein 1A [Alphaproteobacteria bacterium]|nr:MAG: penicillin-binding protein 1A [Alphaproteobacteria bacterium]
MEMSQRARLFLWIAGGCLAVLLLAAVVAGGGFLWVLHRYGRGLPDYAQLADYEPPVVTHIHAGDGSLLTEFAIEKRLFVPIDVVPPQLIHAFLSAEDKNFYDHHGLDYLGVVRAMVTNLYNLVVDRRMVGASTITQQVAKNFLLTNEVSMERKIKEAILALRIERAFTKDRILELYLNEIYLGMGAYGVASAALVYFNKSLDELTLAEMAYLAALPKAPNNYHPKRRHAAAVARRNWVLERMAANGFVDAATAKAAMREPLVPRRMREASFFRADYFLEEVRREIQARYGSRGLYESGLSVHTTLVPRLQAIAERTLRQGLIAYDRRHGWRGPVVRLALDGDWQTALAKIQRPLGMPDWRLALVREIRQDAAEIGFADGSRGAIAFADMAWARRPLPQGRVGPAPEAVADVVRPGDVVIVAPTPAPARYSLQQVPAISGAIVAMDPHSGRVLAMVGGFDFAMSEFNRATQARRQPGSAFKPFVYAAALDAGYTPSTLVLDAPFAMDQGAGQGIWAPRNSSNKFYGPSTLRLGLELSRNLMTVRLAMAIGMDRVADYAKRFDITPDLQPTLAMALGAGETTPLQLTAAYAMLANGGKHITPSLIDRIQDRRGRIVFRHDARPCAACRDVVWQGQAPPQLPDMRATVVDPRTAYQVVHMLEGVVERGTGRRIASLGRPLAGKTGTTNEGQDAWFIGFSPDLAVGVYTGFDQPQPLGPREEGASVAAPIFKAFMAAALADAPHVPFRIPSGIRLVRVNAKTGLPPQPGDDGPTILEAFKPGTEPQAGKPQLLDEDGTLVQTDRAVARDMGGIY